MRTLVVQSLDGSPVLVYERGKVILEDTSVRIIVDGNADVCPNLGEVMASLGNTSSDVREESAATVGF